jgi:ATP-dependent Clp protease ATP-binding subunit ClpA
MNVVGDFVYITNLGSNEAIFMGEIVSIDDDVLVIHSRTSEEYIAARFYKKDGKICLLKKDKTVEVISNTVVNECELRDCDTDVFELEKEEYDNELEKEEYDNELDDDWDLEYDIPNFEEDDLKEYTYEEKEENDWKEEYILQEEKKNNLKIDNYNKYLYI